MAPKRQRIARPVPILEDSASVEGSEHGTSANEVEDDQDDVEFDEVDVQHPAGGAPHEGVDGDGLEIVLQKSQAPGLTLKTPRAVR